MSEIPKHPVDALKAAGVPMTPEQETHWREYCDEEVFVRCGCSVKAGHKPDCKEAQAVIE